MPSELATLKKSVDELKARVTDSAKFRVTLTPVSIAGTEGQTVDVCGTPTEPGEVNFKIIDKILSVLVSGKRHNLLMGGRSAAKSHSLARFFIALAVAEGCRVLCLRHVQNSLQESVYFLLRSIIESEEHLNGFFEIQANQIIALNGSIFAFKGCQQPENLKSAEQFKYTWLEESQMFSDRDIQIINPTLRMEGSRLFYNLNPTDESDAVYAQYALAPSTDTDLAQCFVTYLDNVFCPEIIKIEAEKLKNRDVEKYAHIYGGLIRSVSEARIFHNFRVESVNIANVISQIKKTIVVGYKGIIQERRERLAREYQKLDTAFYIGLDFGYVDPTSITLNYIYKNQVFILKEFYREKVEIDELPRILRAFDSRISEKWPVTCDNSRPEIISYLKNRGINAQACIKANLIDRIDDLQTFDLIINSGCLETAREFSLYSWSEDRNGKILPVPRDTHNHCIDSIFYGLGKAISQKPKAKYTTLKNPYTG